MYKKYFEMLSYIGEGILTLIEKQFLLNDLFSFPAVQLIFIYAPIQCIPAYFHITTVYIWKIVPYFN